MSLWPIVYCPDWIADCCGFTERKERMRRKYQLSRAHYFYSPSSARLDHHNHQFPMGTYWPPPESRLIAANHLQASLPQPYILLTQPVIIANNPGTGQLESMTLVQHALSAGLQQAVAHQPILGTTNTFANSVIGAQPSFHIQQTGSRPYPMMGLPIPPRENSTNNIINQPGSVSGQYAIYSHLRSTDEPFEIPRTTTTNFMAATSSLPVTTSHNQQNIYSDAAYHRAAMAMVNRELQQLQNQLREPESSYQYNKPTAHV